MPGEYLSVAELRSKDVINISDGNRLGYLHDVNFDIKEGYAVSFVVLGEKRFFGLFGRTDDYVIPWKDIKMIGDDVILIESEIAAYSKKTVSKRLTKREN